ncbi:hypothetical protein HSBAA_13440 [Vreelandella sulfidaeris]|uniref:FAD/NAD(P)-binding domain-containing protein n=1 Tax=Vreelandella sulfidaeris TaxID=115553 RepID=A0A455U705_9GAMM|nr:hypothetical protein HSBAA_13440 [Halomonas sulfidaeris]
MSIENMSTTQQLIVIGNGMVGHHLVEQLVDNGALERYQVTVFGEERHRAYDRVHLSEYFSGRDADSLALCEGGLLRRQRRRTAYWRGRDRDRPQCARSGHRPGPLPI